MDNIDHDDLMDALGTCGKGIGFALAAALRSGADFKTASGMAEFNNHLIDMLNSDRFSPDVSLVLGGISEGIGAFARATPNTPGEFL